MLGRAFLLAHICLLVADEGAAVEFGAGLAQFRLGIHDDGTVPGDRLLERLAGDEQEANTFGSGLDDNFIAAVEQDERMVFRVVDRLRAGVNGRLGEHRPRA